MANRGIGKLDKAQKAVAGQLVGPARGRINKAVAAREAELAAERNARVLAQERVDVTLPFDKRPRGARHPISAVMEDIEDIFVGMGWEVAEGPELEAEWFNFDALNFGPDHPARAMQDTFYVAGPDGRESGLVLRTHTSPVQIRTMLTRQPPIYVICPGRVYRTDELDATHTPVFTQVEGLAIDKDLTMAHLKGTLDHFARAMFGPAVARPGFALPSSRSPNPAPRWTSGSRARRAEPAGWNGAAAAWSTRTCCAPVVWIRRNTPASRSAWASSEPCSSATTSRTCATWSRATFGSRRVRAPADPLPAGGLRRHAHTDRMAVRVCVAPARCHRRRRRGRSAAHRVRGRGHPHRAADHDGDLVIGQVLTDRGADRVQEADPVCQVDVGPGNGPDGSDEPREIICGATNFAVGDKVVVALPGTVLPGGFAIASRSTYGQISDGMICSIRELGIGTEHDGILVLDDDAEIGIDARDLIGSDDSVVELAITPDRGYALSIRGLAREVAAAIDLPFVDPAAVESRTAPTAAGRSPSPTRAAAGS